jgi:hypothetical protein
MKQALKWVRVRLEIVGGASLIFLAVVAVLIVQQSSDKVNKAGRKDVLLILTRSGIPTNQDFKLIASYESSTSFTGDHLDYFCVELPRFEIADHTKNEWHDDPEKNPILAEALEQAVNAARQQGGCFPSSEEADSETMKIKFESVLLHDSFPTSADIILYDSKRKKLYYVSYKT